MFFIVTTGRSGSTSIARSLNQVDGCYTVHEPEPQLILESSGYRYGEVSAGTIKEILRETRHPTVDGKVYCESNQTLSLIIPILADEFPQAQFIWLIRNGMDVVASTYQKQWYTGHSENHDRYEDCPPLEKAWIDGRLRADRVGELTEVEWNNLSRFAKCCWYWGYVNRVIKDDLTTHAANHFFTLRLEEADKKLPDLVRWMGLNPRNAPILSFDNPAKKGIHHWTDWTQDEHAVFDRCCGLEMDYQYPGWREVVYGKSVRIFVAPLVRSSTGQVEAAREKIARLTERAERAETRVKEAEARAIRSEIRLKWIVEHWTFRWYKRFRRIIGDRGSRAE